ncbi:hypothetical protein MMC08_006694 [Hypocenomyce scalaris]|nr:hypothetical protein [Hypocenomyce scalaris]
MIAVPAIKRRRVTPPDSSEEDASPSTLVAESDAPGVEDFFSSAARWNLEQDYEQRPRKLKEKGKENTRLPIKTAEGRVEPLQVPEVNEEDGDSWLGSEDDEDEVQKSDPELAEEKPKVPVRRQILEAKEELARIASLINEDPEEHAGAFRALAQISSSTNITVKKLALATQLAVYKDVVPGYRIRPLAEADMTEKVSKEVRRLRAFEQALVGSYQSYVKELAKYAKSSRGDVEEAQATLATVAISCACALLLAVPHFNFRGDLLKILVQKLSGKRTDADFVRCRETLETLFHDDEDGTPSLNAVTLMTSMMKARGWRVDESVLNTFLHLRLLSEFSSKGSQNHIDKPVNQDGVNGKKPKFKKEFRTKKQRKLMKERKVIEKEFKEADATVSHEERDRMQAETLKLVFVTYFRILKARAPNLMGAVLEGLAKYAHLINQDFFGDLLEALKDLTAQAETLLSDYEDEEKDADADADVDADDDHETKRDGTRESLLSIITAFALLEGQDASKAASTLSLDLSFFIAHLYKTLYSLALNPDIELNAKSMHLPNPHGPSHLPSTTNNKVNIQTTTVLLLRSLSSILLPPASIRAVPPVRVAAFTKQLLTSSLQLPEKSALAMLGLMNKVTKTHGRKISGMWSTEERRGDGVFDPLRGDLEGSNPYASTIWEGELLRLHYCPGVRVAAKEIEKIILDVK